VRSAGAVSPKWTFDINRKITGSPVLGADGTLYLGAIDGYLYAINPNGTQKWIKSYSPASIPASFAVSDDGFLYVITNQETDGKLKSALHKNSQDSGGWEWSYSFPNNGYTTGSPKIWRDPSNGRLYIFVYVQENFSGSDIPRGTLYLFNDAGNRLDSRSVGEDCKPSGGCGIWCHVKGVWDFLAGGFDEGGIEWPFLDPTPAIADTENLTPRGTALITVADNFCNTAVYRKRRDLDVLELVWRKEHTFGEKHSSPLVLPNGTIVIGQEDGEVAAYDLLTGGELWKYDTGNNKVYSTPASFGRQIFAASSKTIHVLDYDGSLVGEKALDGWTYASPALSSNFVYAVHSRGINTFTFGLLPESYDNGLHGPLSSPAIARDGTIYVVTLGGQIRAYGAR
jgi:outer membrane protein assembly factor BamB